jgi:hypothetical protein
MLCRNIASPKDARHKRIDALDRNLVGCTGGTVATDEFRSDPRTNHLLPVGELDTFDDGSGT